MRYRSLLLVAATFSAFLNLEAASVTNVVPSGDRPGVVAKSRTRSYSGGVQSIMSDGVIRLRDDRLGDIKVVIKPETQISRSNGGAATARDIRTGSHIHGYGTIYGDRYVAKVLTIDRS
jgi:CubicO group peptidase (beta-lactamase class C family)